jgi:hypothetical protein
MCHFYTYYQIFPFQLVRTKLIYAFSDVDMSPYNFDMNKSWSQDIFWAWSMNMYNDSLNKPCQGTISLGKTKSYTRRAGVWPIVT